MDTRSLAEKYLKHYDQDAPAEALWTFQHAGELRRKRLDRLGLRRGSSISEPHWDGSDPIRTWQDGHYREKMYVFEGYVEDAFFRGEKCLYRQKDRKLCYATVIDLKDPSALTAEDLYRCPNCGSVESVRTLLDKCPYCGTHFVVSELYPKVDNFFSVLSASTDRNDPKEKRRRRICGLLGALVTFSAWAIKGGHSGLRELLFAIAVSLLGAVILGYFFWAISTLGTVFSEAGKSLPVIGAQKSGRQFEKTMSQFSDCFTYEHFTGQMLSLLQILMYSDDDSELPFYRGRDSGLFSDVIDCSYRGGLKVDKFQIKDRICTVRVKAYLETLRYDGKRIKKVRDTATLTACRDLRRDEASHSSLNAIKCRSCGGSFDAMRSKVCPYCGSGYEMKDLEWVITDLSE